VSAEIERAVLEVGGPIDSQGATCRDRTTQAHIRTARTGNVLPPKSNSARLAVASGVRNLRFCRENYFAPAVFLGHGKLVNGQALSAARLHRHQMSPPTMAATEKADGSARPRRRISARTSKRSEGSVRPTIAVIGPDWPIALRD